MTIAISFIVGFIAGIAFCDWFRYWRQKREFFRQLNQEDI